MATASGMAVCSLQIRWWYPSRSAAIQDAIHSAWRQLQADKLEAGYAAAVADNPHYPYESAEEAAVLRARRRARQEHDTLT